MPRLPSSNPTTGSISAQQPPTDTAWRTAEWEQIRTRRRVAFGSLAAETDPAGTDEDFVPDGGEQADAHLGPAHAAERPKDLVGLALSGGGLRSAFFNDGLLQALSHRGLLRYVDYLCSVSGGGYIAGHLMTKARQQDVNHQEQRTTANDSTENRQPISSHDDRNPDHRQPTNDSSPWNFHEDVGDDATAPAWHFGRDPDSGRECEQRLPGIGAYLSRSFRFFAGYTLRQLPIYLLYMSFVGLIAALLAISFRSYDSLHFRSVYRVALGVMFGNELLIAFILPLLAMSATLTIALVAWCPLWGSDQSSREARWRDSIRWLAKCGFWLTVIMAATSVAVFMGNDLTKATGDSSVASHSRLNQFALQMTILAGAIQLLAFLGSDRLLRSEQSEAAKWKQTFQAVISNGVVAFAIFTMIHLMARENISGYTDRRDPALVTGDISNWPATISTFAQLLPPATEGIEGQNATEIDQRILKTVALLDLQAWSDIELLGLSSLNRYDRFLLDPDAIALPDSPLSQRDRQRSAQLLPAHWRYWYVIRACLPLVDRVSFALDQPHSLGAGGDPLGEAFTAQELGEASGAYSTIYRAADRALANGERFLHDHNALLHSQQFTEQLLKLIVRQGNNASADIDIQRAEGAEPVDELLDHPLLKSNLSSLAVTHRSRLQNLLTMHFLGSLGSVNLKMKDAPGFPWKYSWSIAESTDQGQLRASIDRAWLNVLLLSLMTSGEDHAMLRPFHIGSTWVVQPHDQRSRWRWVIFWSALLSISLLLTSNLNRNHYLFTFYHRQIGDAFLKGRDSQRGTAGIGGDTPLRLMRPCESGLPFPIYLTAGMVETGDGRGIVPAGIALTPLGATRGATPGYQRVHDAFDDPQRPRDVTLGEAVATSGAAITPLMTSTIALRVLMDFFGARLGRRMCLGEKVTDNSVAGSSGWTLKIAALLAIFLGLLLRAGAELSWLTVLACCGLFFVTAVILWQLHHRTGYPALLLDWWQSMGRKQEANASKMSASDVKPPPLAEPIPDTRWSKRPGIFVADGGFYDYLGVSELFRRRCELIIVSDAGINRGSTTMEALASMCELASSELGVRLVQLDHDMPIEYARLQRDEGQSASQTFLAMRVKYPELPGRPDLPREGLLFYVQMSITDRDPIEIQQIRHRFPSFPDEPTTNQFYSPDQVAAYRDLGYHIGSRLCNHLHRWDAKAIRKSVSQPTLPGQPLFCELKRRLVRSYVQTCYEENFFSEEDVFGESVWRDESGESVFPSFMTTWKKTWRDLLTMAVPSQATAVPAKKMSCLWLDEFQRNADVFSRYMEAVNREVNRLHSSGEWKAGFSPCSEIACDCLLLDRNNQPAFVQKRINALVRSKSRKFKSPKFKSRWTAHLAVVAAAAQQLHRGTPHQVFQVGGRDKLTSVVEHLANDIINELHLHQRRLDPLVQGTDHGNDVNLEKRAFELLSVCEKMAEAIIHEIYELSESVFQGADRVAVVSFVQCLCSEIASGIRLLGWIDNEVDRKRLCEAVGRSLSAVNPHEFETEPSAVRADGFSLPLDFRQLMFDKLQSGYRSHAKKLLAAYLRFLCTGIPGYNEETPVVPQRILNVSSVGTAMKRPR